VDEERWHQLTPTARSARITDAVSTFMALATVGRDNQTLRPGTAYVYPTSLGEWLGHAVELAGAALWQAPSIPKLTMAEPPSSMPEPARTREQGAHSLLIFGAALWSALQQLGSDDLERGLIGDAADYLDEVRQESNGLSRAVEALGSAVFIFSAHVERSGEPPRQAIAGRLIEALAWLAAAVACTDVLALAQLDPD